MTRVIILTLFLSCINTSLTFAQGLQISHEGKIKTINTDKFVELQMAKIEKGDCPTCIIESYFGKITEAKDGTLSINYFNKYSKKESGNIHTTVTERQVDGKGLLAQIPMEDIYAIKVLGKTRKAKQKIKNTKTWGYIFIWTGLTTALAGILVQNKRDRKNVFIAAGAEAGFGIVTLALAKRKNYYFKSGKEEHKVWQFSN